MGCSDPRDEPALTESRRFQKMIEVGDDVVALLSREGRVTYVTERALGTATALAADAYVGTLASEWVHPDDQAMVARRFEELVASGHGAKARLEYRHRRADGSWSWFESSACNQLGDPDVGSVVVVSRQNDDAVHLRERARAASERYEIAQRISRGIVWERDLSDDKMIFSPATPILIGYDAQELPLTVEDTFDFLHPEDVEPQLAVVTAALGGEPVGDSEARVRHKSGAYRWTRISREVQRDREGRPTRIIAHAADIHDQKVAEAKLRDSERRHRALFEGTTVAVILYDSRDRVFLDCNAAALKLYGVPTSEDLRDTTPLDLSAPYQLDGQLSLDAARALIDRALADGAARTEWAARKLSGETFTSDVRIAVIELDDGRRIVQMLIEDVSEQKRNERVVLERTRREVLVGRVSRLLVDGATSAVEAALGEIGRHFGCAGVFVERAHSRGVVERHSAWTAEGTLRRESRRQVDEARLATLLDAVRGKGWLLAHGSDPSSAVVLGGDTASSLLVLPLVEQGVVVGFIGLEHPDDVREWTAEDIAVARLLAEILSIAHARSQAEARTRLAAARDELIGEISRRFLDEEPERALDAVLERVGTTLDFERVSVFAPDAEGRCLTCTHRWNATGVENGWESLEAYPVPPYVFEQLGATALPVAEKPSVRIDEWLKTLQRDVGTRTLQAPIGYGGRVFGLLVVRLRDPRVWNDHDAVTLRSVGEVIAVARVRRAAELALAEAKEAAVAASAAKSSFLANISHELRTPLNGVVGMVDLLAGTRLDHHQKRYCDVAGSSAKALLAVINDVLDFSTIEANKLELEHAPFSLRAVVDDVVEMLALQAERRGLELVAETDASIEHVIGDAARVRQILVNLVSNAVKFTTHGGVAVRAHGTTEHDGEVGVRVEVEDTGIGLPPDAERRLFRPFARIDGSPSRREGGTGLGLAISRDLAVRMGGRIGVTSQLGRGSTFWFELPLERTSSGVTPHDGHEVRARSTVPPAAMPFAGKRVLVVEDSPVNALVTTELLRRGGASFEVAEDGHDALDRVHRSAFDLVLMDCHLPDMDGYETAMQMRSLGVRAPIVALTASATPEDLARCFAAGMNDRVVKPVDARRFFELVSRHVEDEPATNELSSRVFDSGPALERMRGDRALFARVCSRFVELAPGERRALALAVQQRDGRAVAARGHRLRGQAGAVGGHALADSLTALEAVAADARWAAASAALLAVEKELDQLLLAIATVA